MSHFPGLASGLEALEQRARLRALSCPAGRDFASNDYLGLAGSALLADAARDGLARGLPLGAGASRLLRGNHGEHEALEAEAARFFGTQAALFLGGGFQANLAILSCLPRAGDLILHDALVHASSHDGIRLGRATARPFRHNCPQSLREAALAWRHSGAKGRLWIAVESLYSMEGDFAPLVDFARIATEFDAVLIVDEAHATGLYGPDGRGLGYALHQIADLALISLHTCGKALGASGALITADRLVIDTLINRARPFIYATAPSPLMAGVVRAALRALQDQPQLIARATALREHANEQAVRMCGLSPSGSQILPFPVGCDQRALQLSAQLREAGFDLRAIRPPTVPKGAARLRISISGGVSSDDITELFTTLSRLQELT